MYNTYICFSWQTQVFLVSSSWWLTTCGVLGITMHEGAEWQSICSSRAQGDSSSCCSAPVCSTKYLPYVCMQIRFDLLTDVGSWSMESPEKAWQKRVLLVLWPFCFYQARFFWTSMKSIQLLWKYILNWLLLRSWRLSCRNIILLYCILQPSYCADDYSIAWTVGYFAKWYCGCWKLMWVQKQIGENNGREIHWVLLNS